MTSHAATGSAVQSNCSGFIITQLAAEKWWYIKDIHNNTPRKSEVTPRKSGKNKAFHRGVGKAVGVHSATICIISKIHLVKAGPDRSILIDKAVWLRYEHLQFS